jgi:hypothetical protein
MIPKRIRKLMHRHMREAVELKSRGSTVAENAEVRAILDRSWVDGKIGVAVSGMDCDCSAYSRQYTVELPNSVHAFKRWFDEHVSWLDGPESQRFMRPDQVDKTQNWSRDLALEAFEDGHPHVVYMPC